MAAADFQLPPGFRFHPTDDELVAHYLCRKCADQPIAPRIVADIDLSKHDPWDLPALAPYGEKEWYFFTPRDRKYPNGSRPNRAAGSGYWKATGADKPIGHPRPAAIKKSLVFYSGKAPKGDKTNWIMHEYRLADVDRSAGNKGTALRLDDWVLCRIYNKKGKIEKFGAAVNRPSSPAFSAAEKKPTVMGWPPPQQTGPHTSTLNDYMPFDGRLHAESSCSEHVVSPEFTCEKEVQSHPKWKDLENALGLSYDLVGAAMDGAYGAPPFHGADQLLPLPDVIVYQPKAF